MLLGCSRLRWAVPAALLASLEAQLQQASPADVTLALRAAATQQQAGQHTRQHQRPWLLQQHVPGAAGWAAGNSNPAALLAVQCSAIAVAPGLPVVALRSFGWQQHCQQGMARATVQNNTMHTQYAPGIDGGARAAPGSCGVRGVGPNNQLVRLLLERAEDLLWGMTATELCQCLWAAVRLQATPSVQWGQAINHTLSAQMHQLGPGDMCLLLWSLAGLQGRVPVQRRVHRQLLVRSQQLMAAGCFTARDLSAFLWNYWRVFGTANGQQPWQQLLPQRWLATFSIAMCGALDTFTSRQLGVVLRACVLLGVSLDELLLEEAAAMLELRSAQLGSGEIANISSSLLQLRQSFAVLRAQPQQCKVQQHVLPVYTWRSAATTSVAAVAQINTQPAAEYAVLEASIHIW